VTLSKHVIMDRDWAELRDHLVDDHKLSRLLIDRPRPPDIRRHYAELLHAGAHALGE
jgi:hypothetical protein